MKQLSIEQKAKRYDEAIEKLRDFYRDYDTVSCLIDVKEELANLFPELRESKEERMIKSMTRLVKAFYDCNFPTPEGFERKDMLAWLEKQSQAPAWREQDEEKIKEIKIAIYNQYDEDKAEDLYYYFLEPILYGVRSQLKKKWSEEDEFIRLALLKIVKNEMKQHGNVGLGNGIITSDIIAWLKKQGKISGSHTI